MMGFWLVMGLATAILTWMTWDYLRHDPDTCPECLRCLRRAYERTKVEALRVGPGWYEFIKRPEATTHVAYVHENGEVWVPDMGWITAWEFALLTEGKEDRLIGVDAVLALLPEMGGTDED